MFTSNPKRSLRRLGLLAAVGGAVLLVGPASALAAQWTESGDARDSIALAQAPYGPSGFTLEAIEGKLRTLSDSTTPLDVDVYKICITAPATFSATTANNPLNIVGTPIDDTQLFLFNNGGGGVVANDDNGVTFRSTIPAGSVPGPTVAGTYYLAISGFDRDPVTANGTEIFTDNFPGLQTVAATGALAGWSGGSGVGTYRITLTGAVFC